MYGPHITSAEYNRSGKYRTEPDSFYSENPPDRIIGVEEEYDVQGTDSDGKPISADRYITRAAMQRAGIRTIGTYTELGSRIYSDCGHAEHCTPECRGPYQAAAADIAGIAVMSSIIEASGVDYHGVYRISGTWLNDEDLAKSALPNRTNGIHENFMAPASLARNKYFVNLLPTYYATRVAAMAGSITHNTYEFSQKSQGIGDSPLGWAIDRRTTPGKKPMALALVGDKDTMGDDWMRVETRYADAPLSLAARRHALASTSLIIRIAEHDRFFDVHDFEDIVIKDPVMATRKFMADLTLRSTVEVMSGKQMNMLDINEMLVEKVQYLCGRIRLPLDEQQAVSTWVDINDAYRRSKPDQFEYDPYLLRDFPVTTKHLWLHRIGAFAVGDAAAKARSMQWDRILPIGNGMLMMKKSSVTDPQVEELKSAAPPTRAKTRGEFVKDHFENDKAEVISWRKGKFKYGTFGATVLFGDAYGVGE